MRSISLKLTGKGTTTLLSNLGKRMHAPEPILPTDLKRYVPLRDVADRIGVKRARLRKRIRDNAYGPIEMRKMRVGVDARPVLCLPLAKAENIVAES
jgi:hypothetical protein